jgi:hypothetical protein
VDRSAEELVSAAAAVVEARLADHIWATGETSWSAAIGSELEQRGWRVALVEVGVGGQVGRLLGDVPWLAFVESTTTDPKPAGHGQMPDTDDADADDPATRAALMADAQRVRERAGAEVGLAVRAREHGVDTAVSVAIVTPDREHHERRLAFLGGELGRSRAALTTAAILLATLRRG